MSSQSPASPPSPNLLDGLSITRGSARGSARGSERRSNRKRNNVRKIFSSDNFYGSGQERSPSSSPPKRRGQISKKTQSRPEQSKKIPRVGSTTVTGDTTSITQVRTGACQELVDLGLSDGC